MRKFLLLVLLFFFSLSAYAQIRIEKRHYNKGWYVSLNHKKKSADEKRKIESPENLDAAFQQQDSILKNDELINDQHPTNEPETVSVLQTDASDSVMPKDKFVSAKREEFATEKKLPGKLKNPVPVYHIAENTPVNSVPFSHAHPAEKNVHQNGPDEGWMDFVESLIESVVVAILLIGLIIGLILFGLGALIALYPAAAIGILVVLGLISVVFMV